MSHGGNSHYCALTEGPLRELLAELEVSTACKTTISSDTTIQDSLIVNAYVSWMLSLLQSESEPEIETL